MAPIRLLTFTTLFPNAEQPNHGIFVENRLRHLIATGAATATVLAPVPYFPSGAALFGAWGRYGRVPRNESRHGLTIHHPRYPAIPRVGMSLAPALLYRASLAAIRRIGADFDLIDAHYLYPDGVAAIRLGAALGKPVVITARGSDVTQLPDFPTPRRLIQQAIRRADGLIAVSAALRDRLIALGAPPARTVMLRNGVDADVFRPVDRAAARAALAVSGPLLVSVGGLIARKGHDRTIAALRQLPDCSLLIAGEGTERGRLEALRARFEEAALRRARIEAEQTDVALDVARSQASLSRAREAHDSATQALARLDDARIELEAERELRREQTAAARTRPWTAHSRACTSSARSCRRSMRGCWQRWRRRMRRSPSSSCACRITWRVAPRSKPN